MKSLKSRMNESFNIQNVGLVLETSYEEAQKQLEDILSKDVNVKKLADYHEVTVDAVVRKLRTAFIVNRYANKSIKTFRIDFTDKESKIRINQKLNFDNINEAKDPVENIGIDIEKKFTDKAKKALGKDFKVVSVNEINKTMDTIELDAKPSKENYANVKKALSGMKWEFALPF